MSLSTLLPDPQIVFSAELAAAIGLEEAVLLQQIQGLYNHQPATVKDGLAWLHVSEAYLLQLLPFWRSSDLNRISASLESLGVLYLDRQAAASNCLLLALEAKREASATSAAPLASAAQRAASVSTSPVRTDTAAPQHAVAPHKSAGKLIVNTPSTPPGSSVAGDHPPVPRKQGNPLPMDFQPSEDMLELLERFHGVPRAFALQQLEDFTLYWRERGSPAHAWQNKFKQHVQFHWAKHQQTHMGVDNAGQRGTGAARRTRDSSLEHDLTDTSWAD
ncbi:MAG: hypothetical protein Cons2KO_29600 [Congregibacter sp.]